MCQKFLIFQKCQKVQNFFCIENNFSIFFAVRTAGGIATRNATATATATLDRNRNRNEKPQPRLLILNHFFKTLLIAFLL